MKTVLLFFSVFLTINALSAQVEGATEFAAGDEVYKIVEEMPRFPGCENLQGTLLEKKACADGKLMAFIMENVQYPESAKQISVTGKCFVSFIIEKDGSISNVTLKRDSGAGLGEEAVRVVELMNEKNIKWTPGKQRGKTVKVQFILPVIFELG